MTLSKEIDILIMYISKFQEKGEKMEKNRVELRIYGNTYSILTEDDPEYVEELGEFINKEMHSISNESPTLSQTQCAVLVALDRADACKKANSEAINLRAQIKDYIEDAARAKLEVDVARREIERLNREISALRNKLAQTNID